MTDIKNFSESIDAKGRAETYFNTVYGSPDNVIDIELAIRCTYAKAFLDGRDFERNQTSDFKQELTSLLNRYGYDTTCETPDHILAEYIEGCLLNFSTAMNMNINWHTGWKRLGEENQ